MSWVAVAIVLALAQPISASPAPPGGFGHVDFANSGAPAVQADFLEGLALLHDFEYPNAAAAFRRAQAADSGFALAYWGEAMTFNHPIWMQQDSAAAKAALARLAPTPVARRARAGSEREKDYLDAVEILYGDGTKEERDGRYAAAMGRLHERYPDDVDAAAFYGLAILGTAHAGRDTATYRRAASVLEAPWPQHHDHPGLVHYLIHCYDDPTHAPLGLRAARTYAKIAPRAGHAQHMTSHIFLALGMWPETVDANVAAIADVDRDRAAQGKDSLCCGHYPSWLEYAHLQLGHEDEALRTLRRCRAAAEAGAATGHAEHSQDPDTNPSASFASMRLRYLLDSARWSGEVADWSLPANATPGAKLDFAFAGILGAIARQDPSAARDGMSQLEAAAKEVVEFQTGRGDPNPTFRVRPDIFVREARALLSEQEGDPAGAEKLLREAVDLEEKLPIAFGPPAIDLPTHELLGEFLLRHGRKSEARAEFEKALARAPGRRRAQEGLAAASAATPARSSR